MLFKQKMIVEKQKKQRVYIQLPSLYDVLDEEVQDKIIGIAGIFATELCIKLTCGEDFIEKVKHFFFTYNIVKDKKNAIKVYSIIPMASLCEILRFGINCDDTIVELFAVDERCSQGLMQGNENSADFYMNISDNDGPYILFNKLKYEYKATIIKIENILNG